jgi:H+ antiporter protein
MMVVAEGPRVLASGGVILLAMIVIRVEVVIGERVVVQVDGAGEGVRRVLNAQVMLQAVEVRDRALSQHHAQQSDAAHGEGESRSDVLAARHPAEFSPGRICLPFVRTCRKKTFRLSARSSGALASREGSPMLDVLADRTYRHLFLAQVIALLGTGLATVALGLLAYDLAGANAGAVLGGALAIKMIAYIGVGPVVNAFVDRLPRRAVLVSMDVVRAAVALCLPFVDQVWQVYTLIFLLQSASATFTPTFQATIPDVLPDEERYTKALSLSRLAYDLESLVSPMLAAALLTVISFHWLFAGTVVGFLASAGLVMSVMTPQPKPAPRQGGIYARTTRGSRIYLQTPRLRGLLALNLAAAAAGAMVIVNTVVYVRTLLGRSSNDMAIALAAFGGGSMVAALLLPRFLQKVSDRRVMLAASGVLVVGLLVMAAETQWPVVDRWPALLAIWFLLGIGYSAVLTPSGRLLRRSASAEDRSAVFAAQFALSHACWLVTYWVAGNVGARIGMGPTMAVLAGFALAGTLTAIKLWPAHDPDEVVHSHADLQPDHPHLAAHPGGARHAHAFFIDDLHRRWPGTV